MSTAIMSTSHLRLTPRGRAVFSVLGAVLIAIVAAALILGAASASASGGSGVIGSDVIGFDVIGSGTSGSFEYVQVESGQSLWQIAESIAPDADPREVISDIVRLNQLGTAEVQPGQQIAIPTEYTE